MKVEQIYTDCLAEATYYIESEGEAVIIDPLREVEQYIAMAEKNGATIKYVLETHFHADFVSGHLDLAKKTGATIVYGPTAKPAYPAYIIADNEVLKVGAVSIKALHTPGHTMESTTYLLRDDSGKDYAIFTGDTLFLGDVGRPDLAIKQGELTQEDLAAYLFDSLRNKIMPLADDVIVYPGHGAGSACGKKMSKETWGYLGEQKLFNYALRGDMTKAEFIREVTTGLVAPPQYFPENARMNKIGYTSFDEVKQKGVRALNVSTFKTVWENQGALVIDTRQQNIFAKGFIPDSIFIGIDDNFAMWVGALVQDIKQPILFIAEAGREEEVVTRLARVGYDNALGYLEGGFDRWKQEGEDVDYLKETTAEVFSQQMTISTNLLDVRRESEYKTEHIIGANNFPLDFINKNMSLITLGKTYFLHCAGGYRSVIAASILKTRGFHNLVNIKGGYQALRQTELARTVYQEQLTAL